MVGVVSSDIVLMSHIAEKCKTLRAVVLFIAIIE